MLDCHLALHSMLLLTTASLCDQEKILRLDVVKATTRKSLKPQHFPTRLDRSLALSECRASDTLGLVQVAAPRHHHVMATKFIALLATALLGACATATGDSPGKPDAKRVVDARPTIDSAPDAAAVVEKTLSQNTSDQLTAGSMACALANPQRTVENSYYRVFKLADSGINDIFHVSKITYGIERASAAASLGGKQPAKIKLYNYTGGVGTTLEPAALISLNSLDIMIDDGAAVTRDVAISADVPARGTLVVELALPAPTLTTGQVFFIGSNAAGESKPAFMKAPACNVTVPTSIATTVFGGMDIYLTATGTYP
jgi:hypothetical protein